VSRLSGSVIVVVMAIAVFFGVAISTFFWD